MCYRMMRGLLLLVGAVLLAVGFLPLFSVLPVPEQWATAMVASKLLMLPVGAMCLMGAAGLQARYGRR